MRVLKPIKRLTLLAVVGVVIPGILLAGVVALASQADTRSRERQEHLLVHGFDMKREDVARVAVGYSVRDVSAKNLSELNIEWARLNVGGFLLQANKFEFAAVVRANNQVGYANHNGREKGADIDLLASATAPRVAKIRERERQLAPLAERVASGDGLASPVQESNLVRVGGDLYAIMATLVQPDETPDLISGPAPIVVVGEELNADFLKSLSDAYLIDGLRLAPPGSRPTADRALLDFTDASGRKIMAIEWAPERPGHAMLAVALPLMLAYIALLVGLAIMFQLRARRVVQSLIAREKSALHLAYHDPLTGMPNRALV
jgi:sensor domain CHASE-containing protein